MPKALTRGTLSHTEKAMDPFVGRISASMPELEARREMLGVLAAQCVRPMFQGRGAAGLFGAGTQGDTYVDWFAQAMGQEMAKAATEKQLMQGGLHGSRG
jgi:hypothetical protein